MSSVLLPRREMIFLIFPQTKQKKKNLRIIMFHFSALNNIVCVTNPIQFIYFYYSHCVHLKLTLSITSFSEFNDFFFFFQIYSFRLFLRLQ